ncbi:TrmH family RNA methyltransferase [Chlorobium limicola]
MRLQDVPPVSKAELKIYGKLHQKRHRDAEALFLAEGLRTVSELLEHLPDPDLLHALLFRLEEQNAEVFHSRYPGKVFVLTEKECARLSQTATPAGIFGVFRKQRFVPFEPEQITRCSLIVALDEVQDPGNVGTILRTAAWFGADAMICSPGCADRYNPKTVRSSAGSIYALPHYGVDSIYLELQRLADAGYSVAASSLDGHDFREYGSWPRKVALVIGNEANGVSPAVQALAHRLVRIPHAGEKPRVESLNASVSAAILMERIAMR